MVGPRTRINKNGIYIAKPGRGVDDGANYQFFSPDYITQTIAQSGVASAFVNYTETFGPAAWKDSYKIATINLAKPYSRPPICYVQILDGQLRGLGSWVMNVSQLRIDGSTRGNFPEAFFVVNTSQLFIWVFRDYTNTARFYIMENTLP